MAVYHFKALTRDGKTIKDQAEFPDFRAFYEFLKGEGLTLLKYSKRPDISLPRRVKRPELAEWCHNLAFLIRGGVPLLSALRDLREATANKTLKRALTTLIQEVMSGQPLSNGMRKESRIFPPIVITLVALGEETGRLDEALEEASQHLYRLHAIITQTKRAMMYPLFVLFSMTGALLFWMLFVLPKILSLFKEVQVALPLPTRILIAVTHFLQTYILYMLICVVVISLGLFMLYRRIPKVHYAVERLLLKLPVLSKIKRSSLLAFFFEHLSLLLSAGIDILRSLDTIYINIQSQVGKQISKGLKESILRGESLYQAAAAISLLSPLDLRMIATGEQSGTMVEQFQYLAKHYYEVVQGLVETLGKILEPTLIVITGLVFLLIAISLIGPIYELISKIS